MVHQIQLVSSSFSETRHVNLLRVTQKHNLGLNERPVGSWATLREMWKEQAQDIVDRKYKGDDGCTSTNYYCFIDIRCDPFIVCWGQLWMIVSESGTRDGAKKGNVLTLLPLIKNNIKRGKKRRGKNKLKGYTAQVHWNPVGKCYQLVQVNVHYESYL